MDTKFTYRARVPLCTWRCATPLQSCLCSRISVWVQMDWFIRWEIERTMIWRTATETKSGRSDRCLLLTRYRVMYCSFPSKIAKSGEFPLKVLIPIGVFYKSLSAQSTSMESFLLLPLPVLSNISWEIALQVHNYLICNFFEWILIFLWSNKANIQSGSQIGYLWWTSSAWIQLYSYGLEVHFVHRFKTLLSQLTLLWEILRPLFYYLVTISSLGDGLESDNNDLSEKISRILSRKFSYMVYTSCSINLSLEEEQQLISTLLTRVAEFLS